LADENPRLKPWAIFNIETHHACLGWTANLGLRDGTSLESKAESLFNREIRQIRERKFWFGNVHLLRVVPRFPERSQTSERGALLRAPGVHSTFVEISVEVSLRDKCAGKAAAAMALAGG